MIYNHYYAIALILTVTIIGMTDATGWPGDCYDLKEIKPGGSVVAEDCEDAVKKFKTERKWKKIYVGPETECEIDYEDSDRCHCNAETAYFASKTWDGNVTKANDCTIKFVLDSDRRRFITEDYADVCASYEDPRVFCTA